MLNCVTKRGRLPLLAMVFLVTTLSACASKRPAPPQVPNWFVRTQSDDLTLYGKGSDDRSQGRAVKIALTDISGQLSVSINSTTSSRQRSVTSGDHSSSFSDDSIDIGAKTQEINFKGYSVENSQYVGGIHYVLVAVDRAELLKNQKNDLKNLNNTLDLNYQTFENAALIQAIKSSKELTGQILRAQSLAKLVASLDSNFNVSQARQRYDGLLKSVQQKKSLLSFFITPNSPAEVQVVLAERINSEQIGIIKNKAQFKKNTHVMEISIKTENKTVFGSYMTILQIQLNLKEQGGNLVASKRFEVSGSSMNDYQKSKQNALKKFTREIASMDLLEVLGIL